MNDKWRGSLDQLHLFAHVVELMWYLAFVGYFINLLYIESHFLDVFIAETIWCFLVLQSAFWGYISVRTDVPLLRTRILKRAAAVSARLTVILFIGNAQHLNFTNVASGLLSGLLVFLLLVFMAGVFVAILRFVETFAK